eukprot:scaffold98034_cov63-Phaeocystis_antarctica.AAC.10
MEIDVNDRGTGLKPAAQIVLVRVPGRADEEEPRGTEGVSRWIPLVSRRPFRKTPRHKLRSKAPPAAGCVEAHNRLDHQPHKGVLSLKVGEEAAV